MRRFSAGWLREQWGMDIPEEIPDCATAEITEIRTSSGEDSLGVIVNMVFGDFEWIEYNYTIEDGKLIEP